MRARARRGIWRWMRRAGRLNGEYLDEHQQVQPAAAAAHDRSVQEQLLACSARWTGLDQAGS